MLYWFNIWQRLFTGRLSCCLMVVLLLLTSLAVTAAEQVEPAADGVAATAQPIPVKSPVAVVPGQHGLDTGSTLLQVMFGLAVVLMLIFAIAWFLRRFGQGGLLSHRQMKVVASLPLGARERIAVVDVAGQQLLLGVAPGRISMLHEFPAPVIGTSTERDPSEFSRKIRDIMKAGA